MVRLLLLLAAIVAVVFGESADDRLKAGAANHERNLGEKAMRAGQLKQAITHYDKSIELAPQDPINYYQRASAYMIDRKYTAAERDLNKALELDPKYTQALKKRARMFAAQGKLESAISDYNQAIQAGKTDQEIQQGLQKVQAAQNAVNEARKFMERRQWNEALDRLNSAIEVSADSVDFLLMRAQCKQEVGDQEGLLLDAGLALKVSPGNMQALLLRGKTYYYLNDFDLATRHFREGLRMDPEHKELKVYMKLMKNSEKTAKSAEAAFNSRDYKKALEEYTQATEIDPKNVPFSAKMVLGQCRSFVKLKKAKEAISACSRHIDMLPESSADRGDRAQAFVQRAEAHILLEDYEEGVRDYERAKNLQQDDRSIAEGLESAKKRAKMSKRKDYYKILEISPDADERTIRKAYKKLAIKYHPDKVSADEREVALKKFRDVAEAHEILSDPEKKARFDSGEEVDQPQHQQQDPFAAFQQFHFNFGGGNFHFG